MVTRSMWVRRILSIVILLAIVGALVFFAVRVVSGLTSAISGHQEKTAASTAQEPVEIPNCTAEILDISAVATPPTTTVGQGLKLATTITNKGSEACYLDTSLLSIKMITGDYEVWSPSACTDSWNKSLLLTVGEPWQTESEWNGGIFQSCEAVNSEGSDVQAIADAGTYRLKIALDGNAIENNTVVVVQ